MKTKSIITVSLLVSAILFSCGPSAEQKQMMADQDQKAKEQKAEVDYMNKMESIRTLQSEIIKSMTFIKDTTIRFQDGKIYVPTDEIWEIKKNVMDLEDSIPSPINCECPAYQKNVESSTSSHDAIINGRCIKFNGVFVVNENGKSSYARRVFDVTKPKYVPADVDLTLMEHRVLIIKRYKIKDVTKITEIKRLAEITKTNPNHQILKEYYYTHCFNDMFETSPITFGTCTEIGD